MEQIFQVLARITSSLPSILPSLISLAAVIVSGRAISGARKTQLTSAYFTEKTKAYNDYLSCIADFVYNPGDSTRDKLVCSLYRIGLFASDEVNESAHSVYVAAIQRSREGVKEATALDDLVNVMRQQMRADLKKFDHR